MKNDQPELQKSLNDKIYSCNKCILHKNRIKPVLGILQKILLSKLNIYLYDEFFSMAH